MMLGLELTLLLFVTFGALALTSVDNEVPEPRIVSGIVALEGQFPWQVILKRHEVDTLLCGGSIINKYWVLTAAHCTYGHASLYAIFGVTHLNPDNAVNMTITKFYEHPAYNSTNLNNDISLIRLPASLHFSRTIQAIQLVPSSMMGNSFLGREAVVSGFGLVDDDYLDYPETLMWAKVQIIDKCSCIDVYGGDVVLDSTLCARGLNNTNQSICTGDSGGPLIALDNYNNIIQIGINSFVAEEKCTLGYPSGYVRLTSFLTFIEEITGLVLI